MREAQRKTNATTNCQKKPSVNGHTSWIHQAKLICIAGNGTQPQVLSSPAQSADFPIGLDMRKEICTVLVQEPQTDGLAGAIWAADMVSRFPWRIRHAAYLP